MEEHRLNWTPFIKLMGLIVPAASLIAMVVYSYWFFILFFFSFAWATPDMRKEIVSDRRPVYEFNNTSEVPSKMIEVKGDVYHATHIRVYKSPFKLIVYPINNEFSWDMVTEFTFPTPKTNPELFV